MSMSGSQSVLAKAEPAPIRVQVWRIDLDRGLGDPRAAMLSADELVRAQRLINPAQRARFVIAHDATRRILSHTTGVHPRSLVIAHTPMGKPLLDLAGAPHFNLAHSAGRAVLAVCADHPIGIDLEAPRERANIDAIAARFFSTHEAAWLS